MSTLTNRFEYGAKIVLYVLVALIPIWFLPFPIGVEFGREMTFGFLIVIAAILWFLSILTEGKIRFRHSPIVYAGMLLALVWGISSIFSKSALLSVFLADPVAEKFSTLILGLILMILVGSVLKSQEEVGTILLISLLVGTVSGFITILQLLLGFSSFKLIASFAQGADFNVIGTINGLALFYATLLIISLGLFISKAAVHWRKWLQYFLLLASAIFFFNILLINFRTAWIILLGSGIILFSLMFKNVRDRKNGYVEDKDSGAGGNRFDWRFSIVALLIALSVVMLFVRSPIFQVNIPAEVSPSFVSTINVALSLFKDSIKSVFLGSGPATFGFDWNSYKDPSINQTLFWGVRFNQGYSWLATIIPTVGIMGVLALLVFLAVVFITFLRQFFVSKGRDNAFALSIFFGLISVVFASFLYPANFTLIIVLFLVAGLLSVLLSETPEEGRSSFWSIKEKFLRFETQWAVFISSLVVIFFLAFGIAALYFGVGRVQAAFAVQSAQNYLNKGNVDQAIAQLERAVMYDSANFRNSQMLVQVRMERIRGLIQRAAQGENVAQEFQSSMALAVQNSQRATSLNVSEPLVWRTQGALYELIIPFIQGAEQFAFSSYQKAVELDPSNPSVFVDLGRAYLIFADRIQTIMNQPQAAANRSELQKVRTSALQEAQKALEKAAGLKPDFAAAHFLLAQTALRMGNVQSALQSTENAKISAPFDIGVAFQLGLLYYQINDLDMAQAEFERAVSLNVNYSNARYFLGLIYDRKGSRNQAIDQFEKILVLNPDNQEVQRILMNLRTGRSALEGIVPPAESPERRKEEPVSEETKTAPRIRR